MVQMADSASQPAPARRGKSSSPSGPAAAITAPATQTASYVQADAQSLKTAIDLIRAALTAAGITL